MQGTESTIFQGNGSPQVGIFRLRSCCNEWRNYSGRKERFDIGGSKKIIRTFFALEVYQASDARSESKDFQTAYRCTSRKLSIGT